MTIQETPHSEARPDEPRPGSAAGAEAGNPAPATEVRRPGRPPQTDEEAQRARENILRATSQVFAEFGYHGINVAKIIDAAGIARPTFYRYFRNTDEALTVVLRDNGRSLGRAIVVSVRHTDGAIPKVLAAIDAYLTWSMEHSHLLQSLYAGMHDPTSLVFNLRPLVLDRMVGVIGDQFELVHRPRPDPADLDVLLNSIEFACYRLHLDGANPERVEKTRLSMIRMALAVIGSADDWRFVLDHPEMLRMVTGGR